MRFLSTTFSFVATEEKHFLLCRTDTMASNNDEDTVCSNSEGLSAEESAKFSAVAFLMETKKIRPLRLMSMPSAFRLFVYLF
jgi:hypothetical protein